MSMQMDGGAPEPEGAELPELSGAGFPEFTELGRNVELLRIHRGISKQHLARFAGISRQQLWRVMTGKSELTVSLRERLAQTLGVDARELVISTQVQLAKGRDVGPAVLAPAGVPAGQLAFGAVPPRASGNTDVGAVGAGERSLAGYITDPEQLRLTISSLPGGADGLRLKRQLLNALEDMALERSLTLPASFFDARRQVLAGEL